MHEQHGVQSGGGSYDMVQVSRNVLRRGEKNREGGRGRKEVISSAISGRTAETVVDAKETLRISPDKASDRTGKEKPGT